MPVEKTREQRLNLLNDHDPALKLANLKGFIEEHDASLASQATGIGERTKTVRMASTNAVALGLDDVGTVIAILAFVTASGAPATKTLLAVTTDYTVAAGDITPVGNHSTETWVIHYTTA